MTIDKAIKNLTDGRKDAGMIPEKEYTQTIDLAREALNRIRVMRSDPHVLASWRLNGETEK